MRSSVRAYDDPDRCASAVQDAALKFVVTTKGNFRAELTQIELPQLRLLRLDEDLPRVVYSALMPGRFMVYFLAESGEAPVRHSGLEVVPGDIISISRGASHHHRSETSCSWGGISIAHDDLAAAGRSLAGVDLAAPAVTQRLRPPPALRMRLLKLHRHAAHLAKTAPAVLAMPEVQTSVQNEMMQTLVGCLTDGATDKISVASGRRLAIMKRFEDFLAGSVRPVYVQDICSAVAAPERTLRVCCEEHLGMGPMRYLWLRRMHLARNALVRSDPATVTVTEIATEFGFWELGRFSREYRQLFGELPSITLRRPPADRLKRDAGTSAPPALEIA